VPRNPGKRRPRKWPSIVGTPEERASTGLARLEDITRLVSEWVWETDSDGRLVFVSDRVKEVLGFLPVALVGKKLTELGSFSTEGGQIVGPDWRSPFRELRFDMPGRNGEIHHFLVSGLPFYDRESWELEGFCGISEDVTERLRSENALRKLSSVIEQSPSMIFITDTDGMIEYANPQFEELTGYTPEEAIGRNPRILKSEDTPPEVFEDLWKDILSGRNWHSEIKNKRKDGTNFWASVSISPIRTAGDEISHFVAVHEDITERRETEERLKEAKEQAEVANRAKSEILANTSHELRTPLNAIIGFSGALKDREFGALANEKQLEYIKDIHASGEHLLELINDILDVAAIEAGKLELYEEPVDVRRLATACARLITPRAEEQGVHLSIGIENGLSPINVDERRVKQILLNLLSNAVKFTDEGGEISLSAGIDEAGWFFFSVIDTGIGMDHSEIAKALTQFGQVDSKLARKYAGTGLGLPLTRGLIELHGGVLGLKSEKGVGTTATVRFPPERVIPQ
jgi:PAS domain S-box-containing protein